MIDALLFSFSISIWDKCEDVDAASVGFLRALLKDPADTVTHDTTTIR